MAVNTNRELVLRPRHRATLRLLVVCFGLGAAGVWMLVQGDWLGWLPAIFFGIGTVVFAAQLLPNASLLRISPDGILVRSLFRSHVYGWSDVDRFSVSRIGRNKMVVLDFSQTFAKSNRARRLSKLLTGWEGALPDTYGMSAEALAELLNECKIAAELASGSPCGQAGNESLQEQRGSCG